MSKALEKTRQTAVREGVASITTAHNNPFSYAQRLGVWVGDTLSLVEKIEAGFSYQSFERLQREMDLTSREMAELIRIKPRTLTRRKAEGRLKPDESERLLRASRLFDNTVELCEGDIEAARKWLTTSKKALDGKTPLDFARSEIGAREVENLIGRLEHGVYS